MALFSLIVLLIVFAWLGIVVDRRIDARKRAQRSQTELRLQRFRTWGDTTFAGQRALQRWLAQLPDEAMQALIDKLLDFCVDLGFELDWVLEQKVAEDAALASRLQDIVSQYVESCYDAYLSQEDIRAFETWLAYNEMPYGKEQQRLAERLLTQLIEIGVSPAAAHSLLIAPDKERDIYIHHAVREAAEKDPRAFRSVLKNVLAAPMENGHVH